MRESSTTLTGPISFSYLIFGTNLRKINKIEYFCTMGLGNKISALKERSRAARLLLNKYFIVTFAFLLTVGFIDKNNAIKWIQNKYKISQQERLIRQYKKDIQATDDKIKELTSDLDSLEKYAREHYYFQKENEEVFIVE